MCRGEGGRQRELGFGCLSQDSKDTKENLANGRLMSLSLFRKFFKIECFFLKVIAKSMHQLYKIKPSHLLPPFYSNLFSLKFHFLWKTHIYGS